MAKDEHDGVEQAGEVDRRSGLAGGAATKDETTGLDGGGLGTLGAIYQPYPQNFSSKFFSAAAVRGSVQRIKSVLPTRDALWWGNYQKYAPANPRDKTNWGNDATLYDNWEAAVDEAREALRKQPVDSGRPGPDPDHPTELADNLLDHLDKTVRIALWDKHQLNHPNESGIEIVVKVFPQGLASRRHNLLTIWHEAPDNPSGDPKYKYDKLTIAMTCPVGGWIGTAVWHYTGPSRFTRFTATYTVPALPHDSGQIIFIFNGLESMPDPAQANLPGILQPVLQWTSTHNKWAIRSWYVPSNYMPSIDDMPDLQNEKPFTNPNLPAWTPATTVQPGEVLTAVIEWNGSAYESSFVRGGNTVAKLTAPGILPLTYPVCVIEAYNYDPRNKKDLVNITMENIALYRADTGNTPVEPTWEIGTETDSGDGIHHGTGKLKRYKVVPSNNNATLTFSRK